MKSRRNYYRLLRVQPDASIDVIKLCYRTLMQTLQYHPDLGGEEWNAQNINIAYAVLRNPKKREAYDQKLFQKIPLKTVARGHLGTHKNTSSASRLATGSRRNFYRIMQIQPDAEPEIIRAVYKLLKRDEKANHELIDKVWATLSDKSKRIHYDNSLKHGKKTQGQQKSQQNTQQSNHSSQQRKQQSQNHNRQQKKAEPNHQSRKSNDAYQRAQSGTDQQTETQQPESKTYSGPQCLFCKTPYNDNSYAQRPEYCYQCKSPLQAISSDYAKLPRRAINRQKTQIPAAIYSSWPSKPTRVSATDMSPTGFGFVSKTPTAAGELIKIDTEQFSAIAEVRYCKPIGPFFKNGARFLTVKFHLQRGAFFARTA